MEDFTYTEFIEDIINSRGQWNISASTVRKFEEESERVLREHPILKELVWGCKGENFKNK